MTDPTNGRAAAPRLLWLEHDWPLSMSEWLLYRRPPSAHEQQEPGHFTPTEEREIQQGVRARQINDEINRRYVAERPSKESYNVAFYEEALSEPPPRYRVESLMHEGGSTLLVAQNKVGKTTLALCLAHAMTTGEPFLREFPVTTVEGRVAYLNAEVSGRQFAGWAQDMRLPEKRFVAVNLQGKPNPFSSTQLSRGLARELKHFNVDVLIVDPFGRMYTGVDQNDNGLVDAWLTELERFARDEVGASELILIAHAGKSNTGQARGASALEGWPDSIIRLQKDSSGRRSMRADGRDVLLRSTPLEFDQATRVLYVAKRTNKAAGAGPVRAPKVARPQKRSDRRSATQRDLLTLANQCPEEGDSARARWLIEHHADHPLIRRYATRANEDQAQDALRKNLSRARAAVPNSS